MNSEPLYASKFGAAGDGVVDDAPALTKAIEAAFAQGRELYLDSPVYGLGSTVNVDAGPVTVRGGGQAGYRHAILKALGPMQAVVSLGNGGSSTFDGIGIDGNLRAKYGIFIKYASFSRFKDCYVSRCLVDGFHSPRYQDELGQPFSLNDSNHFEDCWAVDNGRWFVPSPLPQHPYRQTAVGGVVSCTAGSKVLQFSPDTDMAPLAELRVGDFICLGEFMGPAAQYLRVDAVNVADKQLTVGQRLIPNKTLEGQPFIIAQGGGYWEAQHGDNNINKVSRGLFRSNAGAGIQLQGLVGALVTGSQCDFNGFYGIGIGPGNDGQTYATHLDNPYFEANCVAHVLASGAYGLQISMPEWGAGSPENIKVHGAMGVCIGGGTDGIKAIGSMWSDIPTTRAADGFRFDGKQSSWGTNAGELVTTKPIPLNSSMVICSANSTTVMTATPTFSPPTSKFERFLLLNQGQGNLVLQDELILPGSGLRLSATSMVIGYLETAEFLAFNGQWLLLSISRRLKP